MGPKTSIFKLVSHILTRSGYHSVENTKDDPFLVYKEDFFPPRFRVMGKSVPKKLRKGNGPVHNSSLALVFQKETTNVRSTTTFEQAVATGTVYEQVDVEVPDIPQQSVHVLSEAGKGKETDEDGSGPHPKKV